MKILIRLIQGLLALILCALLLFNGWALIQLEIMERSMPEFHGVSLMQVEFDTMRPALYPGDMALVVKQSHYALGDPVVISTPEGGLTVTRLVGSVDDLWITKAETASQEDPLLLETGDILGVVEQSLPMAGKAAKFLWSLPGLLVTLVVGILLLKLPGWLLRPGRPSRSAMLTHAGEEAPEPAPAPRKAKEKHTPRH